MTDQSPLERARAVVAGMAAKWPYDDFGAERLAYGVLRALADPGTVEAAVPAIAEAYETFSQRGDLRTAALKPELYRAIVLAALNHILEIAGREGT